MVSGGELVNNGNNLIDFNELFDDSLDGTDINDLTDPNLGSTINTPLVVKPEPMFPTLDNYNWIFFMHWQFIQF